MPSVHRVVTGQTTVTIGEGEDALHVTVWMNILSPKALRNLAQSDKGETVADVLDSLDNVVTLLTQAIVSWDLTAEDDGPVIPITFDALSDLGLGLLKAILTGILGAITVGEINGTPSSTPTIMPSSAKA